MSERCLEHRKIVVRLNRFVSFSGIHFDLANVKDEHGDIILSKESLDPDRSIDLVVESDINFTLSTKYVTYF